MTQRSIHPAKHLTPTLAFPTRLVGDIRTALATALLVLATLIITVLTGAGFGFV